MGYPKLLRLILILLPALSQAQLYIGPAIGLRGSTVSFFEQSNKKSFRAAPGFGLDAGLMVSRRMKEKYTFNAQLLYTTKTKVVYGRDVEGASDPLYKNHMHNRFIELPMTYTIEFKRLVGETKAGLSKSYYWFLGAGPTVSYWMGGKGKVYSGNWHEAQLPEQTYKVAFGLDSAALKSRPGLLNIAGANRFQFAINFTGGVILEPDGLQKIIISGSLEIGQRFMADNNSGYYTSSPVDLDPQRVKFHSVRLSVGYVLDTKIEDRKRGKSTVKNKNAANYRRKKRR